MTITVDNATALNVYRTVGICESAYYNFYNLYGWPDKDVVYVNKAGGTQIGTGTIYSKWLIDLKNAGGPTNETAWNVFAKKVISATKIWTWEM